MHLYLYLFLQLKQIREIEVSVDVNKQTLIFAMGALTIKMCCPTPKQKLIPAIFGKY